MTTIKTTREHLCSCGKTYTGSFNSLGCPNCRKERRRLYLQEYHKVYKHRNRPRNTERKSHISDASLYQIVVDPDETWGYCSCFPIGDIQMMLDDGSLYPGTVFESRSGKRQIVHENMFGALILSPIKK